MTVLSTARLELQPFDDQHYDGLRALNSDPQVMRYITGRPETPEETTAFIARVKAAWATLGYSWWAFIERDSGRLIGAGCIQHIERNPDNPLELGWRLIPDAQGKGYAKEAAQAMASFAFDTLKSQQLVAVCHVQNTDSEKIMRRLGMTYRGVERWYNTDTTVYAVTAYDWHS
jgi:RimJ/RimL family protein N-acetyltransferase